MPAPSVALLLGCWNKAPVEQTELGKLVPAGPQSPLRWGHSVCQERSEPQDKAPSHLLGLGEEEAHSPQKMWVPEAPPLPLARTLGLGHQMAGSVFRDGASEESC